MENGSTESVTKVVSQQFGLYLHQNMQWPVKLIDARKVYGRVDVLITPVNGSGQKWVERNSVVLTEVKP